MLNISKIREDFPIIGGSLAYLDNAATAQKPATVIEAMSRMYQEANANVHRGVYGLAEKATEMYESARDTVGEYIGAAHRDEVIFTSGATASLNLAAHSLGELVVGEGDNVIVTEAEHHSNIVPWQMMCERKGASLRVLPVAEDGRVEVEQLAELVDERTRVLAITQCSNVLGSRPDLQKATEIAHSRGVIVVVDGCQGIVHGGVNVAELGCDFYAFSGHKLYGPTGIGVLYGRRELLEQLPPFMGGGEMVAPGGVTFAKTTYAEPPLRFEAGTPNYVGAVGLGEAIRYIDQFDRTEVERHERALLDVATKGILSIDGARVYGTTADKAPILSFNIQGVHPYDMGMILDKLGIAVRTGTHCADPLMARFGVTGMARASFAIYNTVGEAEALVEGVRKAVKMLR
ncbi:MAG: SufS family cysteine desulfurase [Rikenellaceae bacterium]|jgi:cysteine desulfurase/selenocysteine lyase|nr:SufS family cysteine desulfurase [Rikenellaceae bacterium]